MIINSIELAEIWALSFQYLSLMFSLKNEFIIKGLMQTTDKQKWYSQEGWRALGMFVVVLPRWFPSEVLNMLRVV